jgi:phenylalanyl-tRNA synthetase beta chain
MKFTTDWLFDHLETTAPLADILDALTNLGIEVEDVDNKAASLNGFVVGHVLECGRHPNADKLSLCSVTDGTQTFQVVCGAPNVRQDMKVAFAKEGVVIPESGQALKKGVIRSIESHGMLCSARELKLGESHDGIMDLDANLEPGTPLADALALNDCVIDVSLTPNRGDWFSVRGIARELAAFGIGTLKPLKPYKFTTQGQSPIAVHIESEGCSYFTGRVVNNVQNHPSPEWMQKRLKSVGMRPISALVDVTNYICHDIGRPLHVFDADTLHGNIVVRNGKAAEQLTCLNDITYALQPSMVVVADSQNPLALGGVMGGLASSCTEKTTRVFIESALFDSTCIAKTGQALHIISDARTRFERGVDPFDVDLGLAMATQAILDLCGGEATETVQAGSLPRDKNMVTLSLEKLKNYSGLPDISLTYAANYLEKLGFSVRVQDDYLTAEVPTWRHDITLDVDLIEEILRLKGYNNIPATPLPLAPVLPHFDAERLIKNTCIKQGLTELYTWSFTDTKSAAHFGNGIHLEMPLTQEFSTLRPSILTGHLKVLNHNQNKSQPNGAFFEVARTFNLKDDAIHQPLMVAGTRAQKVYEKTWLTAHRVVDAYDVKIDMINILAAFNVNSYELDAKGAPSYYHPGRSVAVKQGPKVLGYFGELHPKVLQHFQVDGPVAAFEVFIDQLPQTIKRKLAPIALSPYQKVVRDFAFIVDAALEAAKLMKVVQKIDPALVQDVEIFDVYHGDKLPAGKKSLAFQVVLQAMDRTLTDEELAAFSEKLVNAVTNQCGGVLRDSI